MGCTKTNEAVFSNELLDTVIEHSFDGIYITDGQATTIKVNRSYLTISGLKASEVLGVNMKELVNNGTISASGTLMALEEKRPITIQQEFKTGKRALITSSPIFNNKNDRSRDHQCARCHRAVSSERRSITLKDRGKSAARGDSPDPEESQKSMQHGSRGCPD